MSDQPAPFNLASVPDGMILTTAGEVRRLGQLGRRGRVVTAPMYDRPTCPCAWCRLIRVARRPDPMRRHTAAMTALRKATR